MAQEVPELRWSPDVDRLLAQAGYVNTVTVLYSLLFDPSVDNVTKFSLNYFPYQPGTRALSYEQWFIVYSVASNGSVTVHSMNRRSSLDDILDRGDPGNT